MRKAPRPLVLAAAVALSGIGAAFAPSNASAEFAWSDTEGKHLDLTYRGRAVARYVYEAIDLSSEERREETYKPFCHLFRPGRPDELLTNGPSGPDGPESRFPHHRGIYYGFSRISYTDAAGEKHERVDTWHCREAYQLHREFAATEADGDSAHFTSVIDWVGRDGETFAVEERTMRFSYDGDDLIVDFEASLKSLVKDLVLDGDPQHAGVHFRAHNDVNDHTSKATYYIRPGTGVGERGQTVNWTEDNDNEHTRDLPWKAMCFTLDDRLYTVAYLDSPDNPKPARHSERDYGRFGSYFVSPVPEDEPLAVRYRFVVRAGEMTPEEVKAHNEKFTGN